MKNLFNKIPKKIKKLAGWALLLAAILALAGYFFWNEIILKNGTNLKIGFVTDWEYGYKDKVGNKLTKSALAELENAVQYFNEEFQPAIVIEGGDMVESSLSKRNTTISQLEEINGIFSKLTAQRGYVFGNHDVRKLSKEEIRRTLGIDYNHTYFDIGDWRLVLMDTNFNQDGTDLDSGYYVQGFVTESEFNWLKEVFQTKKPVILFSHHSPTPKNSAGDFLPVNKNLLNALETHNFLKQFENLVLVVSGHDPAFSFDNIEGINYLIVDNLANIDSLGSFASLQAKYNKYTKEAKINVKHYGPTEKDFEINKKIGKFSLWKE